MKPIRFTGHAQTAIAERGLQVGWVEACVRFPDWREPDPTRPEVERRFKIIEQRQGKVLRVAVVETSEEIRILTAFLDRDARQK